MLLNSHIHIHTYGYIRCANVCFTLWATLSILVWIFLCIFFSPLFHSHYLVHSPWIHSVCVVYAFALLHSTCHSQFYWWCICYFFLLCAFFCHAAFRILFTFVTFCKLVFFSCRILWTIPLFSVIIYEIRVLFFVNARPLWLAFRDIRIQQNSLELLAPKMCVCVELWNESK